MGITVAMVALAFLAFVAMLGTKEKDTREYSAELCLAALIAMLLSALILR